MDRKDFVIESKIKEFHRKNVTDGNLEGLPIIEFLDECVKVEILKRGRRYHGEEEFYISYNDFNKYIKQGFKAPDKWESIIKNRRKVTFTPDVVEWEIAEGELYVTEKIGGVSFPAFTMDNEGLDFGSVYLVKTYWGLQEDSLMDKDDGILKNKIDVVSVKKDKRTLFEQGEHMLEEVDYLRNYLKERIKEDSLAVNAYKENGISIYFNIEENKLEDEIFKDELKRSRNSKRQIDWGNIR